MAGIGGMILDAFGYNRSNFMYDRRQRQIMEYQLLEVRLKQVGLWRNDVREAIELTPKKMEVYLLVIALELTGAATCLCKARVPSGAPPWLVAAGVLAVCSALTYLFLGLWFGLHAFVASQAYKVRILTQLVRLPIPTWSSMEATRTYGSDYESSKATQMLRVPFVTGSQEGWVSKSPSGQQAGDDRAPPADADGMASDPWGLERNGVGITELEPGVNSTRIEQQRHVWLIREAAKFFNTYDAFCRVCLSFGTSSLATFFCFWCLAYSCTELAAPVASWGGMAIFSCISLLLLRTDQSLSTKQYIIGSFLLFMPPVLCAVVTFASSRNWGNPGTTEFLMPLGLFIKGCWFIYFLHIFNAREFQTGAVLPASFKAVLYVDVYGWAKHTSVWWQKMTNRQTLSRRASMLRSGRLESDSGGAYKLPATKCAGAGVPMRPEDVNGARNASVVRGPLTPNPAEVPEDDEDEEEPDRPVSFRPGTFMGHSDEDSAGSHQATSGADVVGERPGLVPWRAFFLMTLLVGGLWWCAALGSLYNCFTGQVMFKKAHYGLEPGQVAPLPVLIGQRVTTGWQLGGAVEPHGFTCDMEGTIFATAGRDFHGKKSVLSGLLEESNGLFDLNFAPSPKCGGLEGESQIQDLALHNCEGKSKTSCNAIVLPLHGHSLISCPLGSASSMLSEEQKVKHGDSKEHLPSRLAGRNISRTWLEDRGGSPLDDVPGAGNLLHPEEMTSLSAAPCPAKHSKDSKESDGTDHNCLVIGTTAKRIVHLSGKKGNTEEDDGASSYLPKRLLQKEGMEVPGPGSFALLDNGHYLGVLHRDANTVHLLDLRSGGRPAGQWKLPQAVQNQKGGDQWAGICAGGGNLYALQAGEQPSIWRFPHPILPKEY
eukprot:TRINITY_DN16639_c0_g1_i4.p1 TRINITY_DN16639_c0_g1~~TRINITY_DN16639_c0_g1_i4.p1  ORF type:complete len:881 (+),score=174.01 TRINITY_DN16639_c0_g1_i4:171-2813(+)